MVGQNPQAGKQSINERAQEGNTVKGMETPADKAAREQREQSGATGVSGEESTEVTDGNPNKTLDSKNQNR